MRRHTDALTSKSCQISRTPFSFSATVTERIENVNSYITFSLYANVCRSLFERHKLLFSFLITIKILEEENLIVSVSR